LLNHKKILGVINITPDSFSDGGKFLDESNLLSTFLLFSKNPELIIDVGFESTAPMNSPISFNEEKNRFLLFLNFLKKNPEIKLTELSLDTYKPESFRFFYQELKKYNPAIKLIMNDVSGVLDNDLLKLLKDLPDIDYVYTCTRIPDRSKTLEHMTFLKKEEDTIVDELKIHFQKANVWFFKNQLTQTIFFDPGFGFSKTFEENWDLIENFSNWINAFPEHPWVIGLSKKSFLRKKCADQKDPMAASEVLHKEIVQDFLKLSRTPILFRVHDPQIVSNFY